SSADPRGGASRARVHEAGHPAAGDPRGCVPRPHRSRAPRGLIVLRQPLLLTYMYFRAYLRDRTALFFSLIVPLMLLLIFGSLNLGAFGQVTLAIDDQANNAASQQFVATLQKIDTLSTKKQSTDDALPRLK